MNLPRPNLFVVAVVGCAAIAILGIAYPTALEVGALGATRAVFEALDWFYMGSVTALLALVIWLALGRYGGIKLGKEDDEPDFSTASWLAMLFSAGMGAGLLFWGVAEPMSHFGSPMVGDSGSADAARQALVFANFHWGLHAWAIYAIAGLILAYFAYRRGTEYLPGAPIRAVFAGRSLNVVSLIADLVAVLAVAFGVAGALGLGIQQIHAGLSLFTTIPSDSTMVSIAILAVIAVAYTVSAATSLDKGIRLLSNLNMVLCLTLVAFLVLAGPTTYLLRTFLTSLGDYAAAIIPLSVRLYPFSDVQGWFHGWTLTYIIWWIAWAPFVGVFIARISRGRTIREFVLGVLIAPTVFSIFWFAVFGGNALYLELEQGVEVTSYVREDITMALFAVLSQLPFGAITATLSLILIFVFLVTSVDSATFVLSMMTTDGSFDPPRRRKLAWGAVMGALGGALLIADNHEAIKAVAISGAIPFTFILLLQCAAFIRALRSEETD